MRRSSIAPRLRVQDRVALARVDAGAALDAQVLFEQCAGT